MPVFNLEERTFNFARDCRLLVQRLPKTISNIEDAKQLVRCSGSIGANFLEANERLGDKDFLLHLKIARKEVKESVYWLKLLKDLNSELLKEQVQKLIAEGLELRKILSAIINKK